MLTLIYKDLLNLRKNLIIVPVYGIFLIVVFQFNQNIAFTSAAVAISYVFMLQACAHDDKNRSDIMLNSLPLPRKTIVSAKYFSIFVYGALAILSYLIAFAFIKIAGLPFKVFLLTADSTAGGLIAAIIMSSLYYPVYFKFGYLKSNIYGMIVFFIFFFGPGLILELGKLTGNYLSWENTKLGAEWLFRQSFHGIPIAQITAGLLFIALSYYLSVNFYSRREF